MKKKQVRIEKVDKKECWTSMCGAGIFGCTNCKKYKKPKKKKLNKYAVTIPEVHVLSLVVAAENEKEAIEKANNLIEENQYSPDEYDYKETLPVEEWTVEELKN